MNGILNVLKPPGMTSHDVVSFLRRLSGIKKIGHTGTLDPSAAGVLPLCIGKGTRVVPYLQDADKAYRAEMLLGVATDTQDAGGNTTSIHLDFEIPLSQLHETMARFEGLIDQMPPMTSAVRVGGRRLYELAHKGIEVDRPTRQVEIYQIQILDVKPVHNAVCTFGSRVLFDVLCSKGTYIRTLCADIGAALGCGAHCSFLLRTRSGPFDLLESVTLEELARAASERRLPEYLLPIETGLRHLPRIDVEQENALALAVGKTVLLPEPPAKGRLRETIEAGDLVCVHDAADRLICVAQVENPPAGHLLQPVRVFV